MNDDITPVPPTSERTTTGAVPAPTLEDDVLDDVDSTLHVAMALLRVAISAFGEFDEPWGNASFNASLNDIWELVGAVTTRICSRLDIDPPLDHGEPSRQPIWDALDVLVLVRVALMAEETVSTRYTVSPLCAGLRIALEKLEPWVAENRQARVCAWHSQALQEEAGKRERPS